MNVVAIFSTRFSETFSSSLLTPFPSPFLRFARLRAREERWKYFFLLLFFFSFPRRKREPPRVVLQLHGCETLVDRCTSTIITIPPAHLHGTPASSRILTSRLISSNSPDLYTCLRYEHCRSKTILSQWLSRSWSVQWDSGWVGGRVEGEIARRIAGLLSTLGNRSIRK